MKRTSIIFGCSVLLALGSSGIATAQYNYPGWYPTQARVTPVAPLRGATSQAGTGVYTGNRGMSRLPSSTAWNGSGVHQFVNGGGPYDQVPAVQHVGPAYPSQVGGWDGGKWGTAAPAYGCASSCCAPKTWCGSVGGLIMSRDRENNLWLSYDQVDIRERVLNSHDADFDYTAGGEARLSRFFNCGQNSIELVYWGIDPDSQQTTVLGSDMAVGLDSILHFDGISYDPGTGPALVGGAFYFDAEVHRLQREYQLHNIELNLLGHNYVVGCRAGKGCVAGKGCASGKVCGPVTRGNSLTLGWTAGVRFLRFDETFLYSTDPNEVVFDDDAEEVHYGIDVENNLIGFQIGGRADYCFSDCFTLFAGSKVGLYGNHISHRSAIFGTNGAARVSDVVSPYFDQEVAFDTTKDDVSILGELNLGLNWRFHPCWNVGIGYRAVGVSGVALTTNQVPVDFIGALDSLQSVDSNANLILHGGFLNVEYCR